MQDTNYRKTLISENTVFNFSIFSGIQYVILTIVAMFIYPGSTYRNNDTLGYTFSENFLSDLGRTEVFNGASNLLGAGIYFWVLFCVGASTILLFTIVRYLLREKKWVKYISYLMVVAGIFAGACLAGIGCAPSNMIYDIHIFFVVWAFVFLLISLLLWMICIYGAPSYPNLYGHLLLLTCAVLGGYVALMFYGPNPYATDEGLTTQVIGQKIIVYTLIISLTFQAYGAKKVWNTTQPEK